MLRRLARPFPCGLGLGTSVVLLSLLLTCRVLIYVRYQLVVYNQAQLQLGRSFHRAFCGVEIAESLVRQPRQVSPACGNVSVVTVGSGGLPPSR